MQKQQLNAGGNVEMVVMVSAAAAAVETAAASRWSEGTGIFTFTRYCAVLKIHHIDQSACLHWRNLAQSRPGRTVEHHRR